MQAPSTFLVMGALVLGTVPAAWAVPRYGVLELSYPYTTTNAADPWNDITVTASFKTPSGKTLVVDGFYADTNLFKVRFTPAEAGNYTYTVTLNGPAGPQTKTGSFTSDPSDNPGFIRRLPSDPSKL